MSYLFLMLLWWPTACYICFELYLYLADDFVVSLLLIRFCVLHFQHTIGLHATRQRRIASSFRDQSLFLIFQISLTSLFKLKADGILNIWYDGHTCMHSFFGVITLIHALNFGIVLYVKLLAGSKLQELSLMLSLSCLSFDFMGTAYDESSDEIGTVQVYVYSFVNRWLYFLLSPGLQFLICNSNCLYRFHQLGNLSLRIPQHCRYFLIIIQWINHFQKRCVSVSLLRYESQCLLGNFIEYIIL